MSSRLERIIKKTQELLHIEKEQPPKPKPEEHEVYKHKPKPKPIRQEGIDYSEGSGLTASQIRQAGKGFVCRYISNEGNPKNINKKELNNLLKAGLAVVLVWETTAQRMMAGKAAGTEDAEKAQKFVSSLGLKDIPIYFAADWDTTEAQQVTINRYLDGVATVIGFNRTGMYAGYWAIKRAFDAHRIKYGWQTYAWSGGKWDPRAQLQQWHNGAKLFNAEVDLDRSVAGDFGQWPRP